MLKRFAAFIKNAASRFRRIASSIGGGIAPKDLHGEVWLAAEEIAKQRGYSIDFDNAADQEMVLNRVYWNVRDQRDWRLASAYSIDDDREGATPWADRLAAPLSTTPLEILLQREVAAASDSAIAASYSQAAAYLVALANFNYDRATLCRHLVLSYPAFQQREDKAIAIVGRQWSLFDGLEIIDPAFKPNAGRELIDKEERGIEAEQREMTF